MRRPSKVSTAVAGRRRLTRRSTLRTLATEFAGREGLHHVVVGAEFEAEHPVGLVDASGEQDHRHSVAEITQHVEARSAREHHVEHHQIGPEALDRGRHFVAVARPRARRSRRVPGSARRRHEPSVRRRPRAPVVRPCTNHTEPTPWLEVDRRGVSWMFRWSSRGRQNRRGSSSLHQRCPRRTQETP